ncbi:circularly permuted type 2 ATP-grasp protein [Croceicoccus mobilis]|uniref:DUF403 domain-containing protein n=1 Tax=Croceicoccus mobilis TaxID=1703339 RepID=A0A916Z0R6_9SPHN|nr:circularly permuted type 2 ATP-grasp protein [Croceicoccus mobilis]GGD70033.1 hypothetical protein GCM10010990_19460 [Croceicoccus mobilis]
MNEAGSNLQGETLFGPDPGSDPLGWYRAPAGGDIFTAARPDMAAQWHAVASGLASAGQGNLSQVQSYLDRNVEDLGLAFRVTGDDRERPWPLAPMPILIGADEWQGIEAGLIQRAEIYESLLADIYGDQQTIANGHLPAALASGSVNFARRMVGLQPPGGYHLRVYAVDLVRDPAGDWRVLSDRARLPIGVGYALENRLALARSTGSLLASIGTRRLAEFFEALRFGIAADCTRSEPRIGLLTPGRFNQSYPEQAHLARHLGFSLVEGRDLTVRDGRLYVRTIAGLKRIDGLWRWINTADIDPLAFDQHSQIGVAGLIDACRHGDLSIANWPGAGVVESRAMAAFLPRLAQVLTGGPLILPNVATWWCGQQAEREHALANFDRLVFASSFRNDVAGLSGADNRLGSDLNPEERAALVEGMRRRPMDYVAQEMVETSTTPAVINGRFEPRPFVLRAFLARGPDGRWVAMPGGFGRVSSQPNLRSALMGAEDISADVCIVEGQDSARTVDPPALSAPVVRRAAGLLPSQAADNLFWLGRYGERAQQTARVVRTLLANADMPGDPASQSDAETTRRRLSQLLVNWGAAPAGKKQRSRQVAASALTAKDLNGSIPALIGRLQEIALLLRDRLTRDSWRAIHRLPPPIDVRDTESMSEACDMIVGVSAAMTHLLSDNLGRSAAWRFFDMGIALERGSLMLQSAQAIVPGSASAEDLSALLEMIDGTALYRSRYLTIPFIAPVLDMALLDPSEPRGLAYQVQRILNHLSQLPVLREDGMSEEPHRIARLLDARIAGLDADELDGPTISSLRDDLGALNAAIARRYFLQPDLPVTRDGSALLG